MRISALLAVATTCILAPAAVAAAADTTGGANPTSSVPTTNSTGTAKTGGAQFGSKPVHSTPKHPTVAGFKAKIKHGIAYAPADAPLEIQQVIWAGNKLIKKPYSYGGGHASFHSKGYDCSGSVSYALHGGALLDSPMDSSDFMKWGNSGKGQWITVYTNPGHAYMVVAGIRLDTSAAGDPHSQGSGPRWRKVLRSNRGFKRRHPDGL